MLTQLLPGWRDLRVPLASGLMWLFGLWVAVGWSLPGLDDAPLIDQTSSLLGFLGPTVYLGIIVFIGYVLGLTVAGIWPKFSWLTPTRHPSETSISGIRIRVEHELRAAKRRGVSFFTLVETFPDLETEERERYTFRQREELLSVAVDERRAEEPHIRISMSELDAEERWQWLIGKSDEITAQVLSELDLARVSLHAKSKELFDEYDRMRAEAEFRHAVSFPLAFLSAAVSARLWFETQSGWSFIALIGIVMAFLIYRSASARFGSAADFMIQSLLAREASSPTMGLITDQDGAK